MKTYSQFLSFFPSILFIPFFFDVTSASNELHQGAFKGIEVKILAYQVNYLLHIVLSECCSPFSPFTTVGADSSNLHKL